MLAQELPPEEVREMTEILTSYHLKGKEEGKEEGREEGISALQKSLLKLSRRKFGALSPATEEKILKTKDIALLERALENIFDLEGEAALVEALSQR